MPKGELKKRREKYGQWAAKEFLEDCKKSPNFCDCLKKKISTLDERSEESYWASFIGGPFAVLQRGMDLPKEKLEEIYKKKCDPNSLEQRVKRIEAEIKQLKLKREQK